MMMKNHKLLYLLIATALASGAGFLAWQHYASAPAATATAESAPSSNRIAPDTISFPPDAPQLTFLQIKPVEAWPKPLVEPLNARISYNDNSTARIFSPVSGRVTKISVDPGTSVKMGDELLILDSPDYAQAIADQEKAQADLLRKKLNYERSKLLLEARGLARKDLESAEADWHQAEAELIRAQSRLKNLTRNAINADGKFVLRAPISGIVSERQVNAGSEVRTDAAAPLFVITDPAQLWVQVDLPEHYLKDLKIGRLVSVEVDAYPGESFAGKVTVIGGALDPLTRRIPVRCEVKDEQHRLKPEMYARVVLVADNSANLPRVPNSALVTQGLYTYLFVENSPGVLQRRRVTLLVQDHDYAYIDSGLKTGERIVTSGALLVNSELAGID